jgi:hypothetical protein
MRPEPFATVCYPDGLDKADIVNSKSWGCIKNLPPRCGTEPNFAETEKIYEGARDTGRLFLRARCYLIR